MDIHDLRVYFNNLVQKSKSIQHDTLYYIKVNKKLRSVINKLIHMNMVSQVYSARNYVALKLENYLDFEPYRTEVFINTKNYPRVINQTLKQDPYTCVIVSTTKGIKTNAECVSERIGGVILAKVRFKSI